MVDSAPARRRWHLLGPCCPWQVEGDAVVQKKVVQIRDKNIQDVGSIGDYKNFSRFYEMHTHKHRYIISLFHLIMY